MKREITIEKTRRAITSLKKHPFYELMQILGTDIYEVKTFKRYGLKRTVLVTESGYILSNAPDVEIAEKMEEEEIEVDVIFGITEEDILRLLCHYTRRLKKPKYAIACCIEYLSDYWDSGEGKDFYFEVQGHNMRDKIVYLLGISVGKFQSTMKIYNYDPELLKQVDDGKVTSDFALNVANNAEVKETVPKVKGPKKVKEYNTDNDQTDANKMELWSVVRFNAISLTAEGYGVILLNWEGEKVIASLNGEILGEAVFSLVNADHGETFHYIIQIPRIGSLHVMGVDFRKCQEFFNQQKNNNGGQNGKLDWLE